MKKKALISLATVSCLTLASLVQANTTDSPATSSTGRTYYVSSLRGNDANNGLSESSPFQTLDKINQLTLGPGDVVKLENGSVFNNQYLHLNGSGSEGAPIIITNYGDSSASLPTINTNGHGQWYQDYGKQLDNARHKYQGTVSSAILLKDVEYIEVSNLAITNAAAEEGKAYNAIDAMNRTGVAVVSQNKGTLDHIYLEGLRISNVKGNVYDKHMNNGGIYFTTFKPINEAETGISRYNDVRVVNNHVTDVNRWGIALAYTAYWDQFTTTALPDSVMERYGATNVVIENNYLRDIGGDAITTMYAHRPLVQNNVAIETANQINPSDYSATDFGRVAAAIWPWKCKDAIFQYNEVYDTNYNQDAQAWDADYGDGTVYQYNYSHNNEGGAIMFCYTQAYRNTFRYNISNKDLAGVISAAHNPDAEVYNNTFIVAENVDVLRGAPHTGGTMNVENNIFYYTGTSPKNENWTKGNARATYNNNLYYNYANVPTDDANAIQADPKFAGDISSAPTSTTTGTSIHDRSAFAMFKLAEDSPAIDAGVLQGGHPNQDFFGEVVDSKPDLGAAESPYTAEELSVASAVYTVTETSISEVPKRTKVSDFKANLRASRGASLEVLGRDGKVKGDGDSLQAGDRVKLTRGALEKEYQIEFGKTFEEYDPSSMTAEVGSFQPNNQREGDGSLALDNQLSTIWHSKWAGDSRDNLWISLDLGQVKDVSMFKYVPRPQVGNGVITAYEISVSQDKQEWQTVASGDWEPTTATKLVEFAPVKARYVKLKAISSISREAGKNFAAAAEVRVGYEILDEGEVHLDGQNTILTSIYQMDGGTLYVPSTATHPTDEAQLLAGLGLPEKATAKVVDAEGNPVTSALETGHKLRITAENGQVKDYQIEVKNTYNWALDYVHNKQGNVWFAQRKEGDAYHNLTDYDATWPNWKGGNYGTVGIDGSGHSAAITDATHGLLADSLEPGGSSQGYSMTYRAPKDGYLQISLKDGEPYLRQAGNQNGSVKLSLTHNGTSLDSVTLTTSLEAQPIASRVIAVQKGDFVRFEALNIERPSKFSVHVTPILTYTDQAPTVAVTSVDRAGLQEELDRETSVKESVAYQLASQEKKAAYDQALEAGKTVATDTAVQQEAINQAVADLQDAREKLDGQAIEAVAAALLSLLEEEEQVKASPTYQGATAETKTAYDQAILAAQTGLEAEERTVASLEALKTALETAKTGLVAADHPSESEEPGSSEDPNSSAVPEEPSSPDDSNGSSEQAEPATNTVDRTALETQLAKEESTKASPAYQAADQEKRTAYDQALQAGRQLLTGQVGQEAIDQAIRDLELAAQALNGQAILDLLSRLQEKVTASQTVKASPLYLAADSGKQAAYDQALAQAQAKLSQPGLQADLEAAFTNLLNSQAALDGKEAESTEDTTPEQAELQTEALRQALSLAPDVQKSDAYLFAGPVRKDQYNQIILAAQTLLETGAGSQTEVDQLLETLTTYQTQLNGLDLKDHLLALKLELDEEEAVKESLRYTASQVDKRAAYDQALQAAKEGLAQADYSKETLASLEAAVTKSKEALDGKETGSVTQSTETKPGTSTGNSSGTDTGHPSGGSSGSLTPTPIYELKDPDSGVIITADQDLGNYKLVVKQVEKKIADLEGRQLIVLDIQLLDAAGQAVAYKGLLQVQVPAAKADSVEKVYYLSPDGKLTEMKIVKKDRESLTFETDHLSDFVLVYPEEIANTASGKSGSKVKILPATGAIIGITLPLAGLGILAGTLLNKKRD
ncbi:TPA: discoidin domain-containing protein [Streptococcus suis]